jgi:phage shock protein PspC (stress-responsive transcriptional regulator)
MVAGVCAGLAEYLGIDATIIRVIVAVLSIFGGAGLIAYVVGWLLIPNEGEEQSEAARLINRISRRS